jgi:hypothetical protein
MIEEGNQKEGLMMF